MCRFVVYAGPPLRMSVLLTETAQSLIKQSYHSLERREPLNGDGFGIGWYPDDSTGEPCVFTSVSPAWSNRNLSRLAARLSSTRVMAHVRAASPGIPVTELNCHPFQAGRLLWMHNGRISGFPRVRRRLCESLPDRLYEAISGNTDSEHIFALFQHQLGESDGPHTMQQLQQAMLGTIERLNEWTAEAAVHEPSYYNFAMTDGRYIVATRYVDDPRAQPETLYFSRGHSLSHAEGCRLVQPTEERPPLAVLIVSEPLTSDLKDWQPIPVNHMLAVGPDLETTLTPIPFGFRQRFTAPLRAVR